MQGRKRRILLLNESTIVQVATPDSCIVELYYLLVTIAGVTDGSGLVCGKIIIKDDVSRAGLLYKRSVLLIEVASYLYVEEDRC